MESVKKREKGMIDEQCKQGFLWYNSHTSSFQMDKKRQRLVTIQISLKVWEGTLMVFSSNFLKT